MTSGNLYCRPVSVAIQVPRHTEYKLVLRQTDNLLYTRVLTKLQADAPHSTIGANHTYAQIDPQTIETDQFLTRGRNHASSPNWIP